MPTSTRFAVAVHALAALAVNNGKPVRSEQIAASAGTNPVVIRAILSRLADASLTSAQLGPGGGAFLAKPAEAITLLDVYKAVEDEEFFAMHRGDPDKSCFVGRNIQHVLRQTTHKAEAALENELRRVTVADIAHELVKRSEA
ncbi:MAG: Rrf2 family transcriptional regulator [Hyphomicrobiales bacterium]|nr:Rrf2 family transcriptional regulator [Hyphomicrobiales bacterium]